MADDLSKVSYAIALGRRTTEGSQTKCGLCCSSHAFAYPIEFYREYKSTPRRDRTRREYDPRYHQWTTPPAVIVYWRGEHNETSRHIGCVVSQKIIYLPLD